MLKLNDFYSRKENNGFNRTILINFFSICIVILMSISMVSASFNWTGGLQAYWDFNEASGIIADDFSNNSRTGILNNTEWSNGIINSALNLNGINSSVNVSDNVVFERSDAFSASFWINTNGTGNLQYIVWAGTSDTSDTGWQVRLDGVNNLEFRINQEGGVKQMGIETSTPATTLFNWTHIVITYDGSSDANNMLIYVNGTLRAKTILQNNLNGTIVSGSNVLKIGSNILGKTSNNFNGSIDEIAIFKRVLNTSDVSILYNNGAGFGQDKTININLITPSDSLAFGSNNVEFNVSLIPTQMNITNATLYVWNNTLDLINITSNDVSGQGINYTWWNVTDFVIGNYYWNVLGCGVNYTGFPFCFWSESNRTFEISVLLNSTYFNTSVFETQSAYFSSDLRMIQGINLYSATLNYNGTRYLGDITNLGGDQYRITRTIDIPLLKNPFASTNKTFFWDIEFRNGFVGNQTTPIQSHEVNPLVFVKCNVTFPNSLVNYTVFNETNRTPIDSLMDVSFDFWKGSGTVVKNTSLGSSSAISSYAFCSNQNGTINVSAVMAVSSTGFNKRTFNFNKERYNNITANIQLYLLDIGSDIISETTDAGLVAMEGIFLNIYRYYPEINQYLIVERLITDEFGQVAARLIERTISYQFEFLDNNNNLLKRTNDFSVICRSTICVIQSVIEDTTNYFESYENVTDFTYSLSYSNDTNTFTYTWNDATSDSITNTLFIRKISLNNTEISCNKTSTANSGLLICEVGNNAGTYIAQAFRKTGNIERRISILNVRIGETFGIFGKEGLIWVFLILFTLIGIGSYNPSIGVGLYLVGFIMFGVLGIVSFTMGILFANVVLCIAFIWAFRS